jgi:ferredoxin
MLSDVNSYVIAVNDLINWPIQVAESVAVKFEIIIENLAREADKWKYDYSIQLSPLKIKNEKVTRKEFLRELFKLVIRGGVTPLPSLYSNARCASPYCTKCKDVCPSNAILLKEGHIIVDPDKCTGCGECVTACPLRSLYMPGLDERRIVDILRDNDASKVSKIIFVKKDELEEGMLAPNWLTLLWIKEDHLLKEYLTKVMKKEVCFGKECFPPEESERAECVLIDELSDEDKYIHDLILHGIIRPIYSVKIDTELCDMCSECARICPLGALSEEYLDPERKAITFNPYRCLGCGACVGKCPIERELRRLSVGIHVIKLERVDHVKCEKVRLIVERPEGFKCFLCGKELKRNVPESTYINIYNSIRYLYKEYKSQGLSDGEIVNKMYDILEHSMIYVTCEDCKDVIAGAVAWTRSPMGLKKSILNLLVLYLSCLHRKRRLLPGDLLEDEGLRRMLGIGTKEDPCTLWNNKVRILDLKKLRSLK